MLMNRHMAARVKSLRHDFESVTGNPFQHFFCPILFKDERTRLCRAHVINKRFRESDRSWTIQRADVDAWFGTLFEDDFLALEYKDKPIIEDALTNKDLARRFRPRLTVDGQVVDHFLAHGHVSRNQTIGDLDVNGLKMQVGLKVSPEEFETAINGKWEFQVDKDIRLPALASVLKAAHLTMFHLMGYRYALSVGGHFLGKVVLGDAYLKAQGLERDKALQTAWDHFSMYTPLVRPVLSPSPDFQGTLSDRLVHFFMSGTRPWACQVLVKTGDHRHAAVVPFLEDPDSATDFLSFLKFPARTIQIRAGRLNIDKIEMSPTAQTVEWTEA